MANLLTVPPLLTAQPPVAAGGDALASAVAACRSGSGEVGAFYLSDDLSLLDLAVVLGPEVGPRRCWEMLFLTAVAFGDTVGAIAPPEMAVHYRWPDRLLINGASVGRVRLAMAADLDKEGTPHWLAIGLRVRVQPDDEGAEPGVYLDRTTLANEGAVELTVVDWAEAFARHFLVWIHTWEENGFKRIHEIWWGRHDPKAESFTWQQQGKSRSGRPFGLDEHGSLLVQEERAAMTLVQPGSLLGPQGETAG
ncbi:MAG: hypothetical protein GDA47_00800 [Rhodospirillales bacterium]|nr:hypothetical protein [Rhodospirillales bacterium]